MTVAIAVTGPRRLTDIDSVWVHQQLRAFLGRAVKNLKDDVVAISGMALKVDTWWADVALEFDVPLHAYIPADTQTGWKKAESGEWIRFTDRAWQEKDRDRWTALLEQAALVVDCSETFPPNNWKTIGALLNHRNRCMVNACTYLCGAWGGQRGGTSNCLEYAHALNRRTYFIDIARKKCDWDSLPVDSGGNLILENR